MFGRTLGATEMRRANLSVPGMGRMARVSKG